VSEQEHWANVSENTTTTGVRILVKAYRVGGHLLFRVLLAPVICFYFVGNGRARRASLSYLSHIHSCDPSLPEPRLSNSFKMFWQFGCAILDKFSVWMGDITRKDVVIHSGEIIDELHAQNKGAVILASHFGNFEICRALSQTNQRVKLTVLVHTKHADKFNKLLSQHGDQDSIELLQVTEIGASTAIRLSEKIANGELIAIAADRVPIDSQAMVNMEFFGKPAPFSEGPFVLATALGATVLMLNCVKIDGRYNIFFDKLSDEGRVGRKQRTEHRRTLARLYVQRLEQLVRLAPLQWFNFFDFWAENKTPGAEELVSQQAGE